MKTMRKRNFRFHLSRAAVRDKLNNNEAREVTIESDDKEVLDNTTMDESETMSLTLLTQDFKVGKPPKLIVFGHNRGFEQRVLVPIVQQLSMGSEAEFLLLSSHHTALQSNNNINNTINTTSTTTINININCTIIIIIYHNHSQSH